MPIDHSNNKKLLRGAVRKVQSAERKANNKINAVRLKPGRRWGAKDLGVIWS